MAILSIAENTALDMAKIILSTLNAKYIHASLGLRYLMANLHELQPLAAIKEFTIHRKPSDIVEEILAQQPDIVGFGVYIWNIEEIRQVVGQLKSIAPEISIVLGGPEISYEVEEESLSAQADYVITGAADSSFYQLCRNIIDRRPPIQKVIKSSPTPLNEIVYPYYLYNDEDLKNRVLYVEASRGCPFKCEFCLSSLDKTSWPFATNEFLDQMRQLYDRGARHFKFVDRTFNLKIETTLKILDFFLERLSDELFLHFEVIPDHLPEKLKQKLTLFPEGTLQFEIGIQTFNEEVQQKISRRQKNQRSKDNLIWLREHTQAHIHADLIFGLPGESLESFAESFDQLYQCRPNEIQVGILKRLKGSPIIRHTELHQMRYNPYPPYNLLCNSEVSFQQMQWMNRFARYWDIIGNSGNFRQSLPLLLDDKPFNSFMQLSHWLYQDTGQTHKIHLKRLYQIMINATQLMPPERHDEYLSQLEIDFNASSIKGQLFTHDARPQQTNIQNKRQKRHAG